MGVNGAFLTGDLFNLFVFFEILLIASFALLVLGSEPGQLRETLKYLVINLIASTFFLLALAVTYRSLGTLNMADLALKIQALPTGSPMPTILALLYSCSSSALRPPSFRCISGCRVRTFSRRRA